MRRGHPLEQTLRFVTGDREYRFEFYAGHSTPSTGLFDQPDQWVGPERDDAAVLLFSGGLDSLAGALSLLSKGGTEVCLVSHQSQPGTKRTQNSLGRALAERFPGKAKHYHFECNLSGVRAAEESQRTRFFLYSSIAFAIAQAYDKQEIFVFENGVTSINYGRRQDLLCARASRTTHPQTVGRMREFLSLVAEKNFGISLPFFWNTKAEILSDLKGSPFTSLISSSVSCSRTFQKLGQATHCGECYQCIDRRIAAYAAGIEDIDHPGLYALDMNNQPFSTGDGRTTAVDYVRQAASFAKSGVDQFHDEHITELADLVEWVPGGGTELDRVERIWALCKRHGEAVERGLCRMRQQYDKPFEALNSGCLLQLVGSREHLKPEVQRLVQSIISAMRSAVPPMFHRNAPQDETDLNEKINALLVTHHSDLRSEHPTVSFACAKVIPDHTLCETNVLVEAKFIRAGTPPSKASDGIAADLVKYPQNAHILFLVLDLDRAIVNDNLFVNDFESRGRCTVCILR